jgi:hypothetical protein
MKLLVMVTAAVVLGSCAGRTAMVSDRTGPHAALLADFRDRIDLYMEVRDDAADETPEIESSIDPAQIRRARDELASGIRTRRAAAKHGDIFSVEIRALFRRLLAPEFKGEDGRDIRAKLQDDAPAPGAVPLEINASYPAGLPVPTTPAPLLQTLPTLPRGLEYRILGRDLVLLDAPTNLILDFIRNAIPEEPSSKTTGTE